MTKASATEELRRLLDERGVDYYRHEDGEPLRVLEESDGPATSWRVDNVSYCAVPDKHGTFDVWIDHCTPEQAVAATLGSGTCEDANTRAERTCKWEPSDFITEGEWWNTECGESFTWEPDGTPSYCPNCGAKVVE